MVARIYTTKTHAREENQDAAVVIVDQSKIIMAVDEYEGTICTENGADIEWLAAVADGLGRP